MVKTPRTRHSKPQRGPVTIELTANESPSAQPEASDAAAEILQAAAVEPEQASPIYSAQPEDEPAVEQPVEDRIEDEAAATGKTDAYRGRESTPAPAAKPRGGWGSHLAAGLIGGLIAAAAGWALRPGAPAVDTDAIDTLRGEISALETEIDGVKAEEANSAGMAASVEQLKSEIAALQSNFQSGGADAAAISALGDKLAQLEAAVGSLSAANGQSTDLASRLDAVEQAVSGLTGKVDANAAQPKIALAIASAALKSAVERGAPFSAELETFAAIAPASPQLEALRAHAAVGVPSRADIANAFPAAADAMAAAANPAPDDAGFFERLLGSAESVIKVRPVGEVAGEEPGARIARMEVAVNAGDYNKALAEFDALPDAVKAAGAGIAEQIRARADVETQVDQLIAEAMKAA